MDDHVARVEGRRVSCVEQAEIELFAMVGTVPLHPSNLLVSVVAFFRVLPIAPGTRSSGTTRSRNARMMRLVPILCIPIPTMSPRLLILVALMRVHAGSWGGLHFESVVRYSGSTQFRSMILPFCQNDCPLLSRAVCRPTDDLASVIDGVGPA